MFKKVQKTTTTKEWNGFSTLEVTVTHENDGGDGSFIDIYIVDMSSKEESMESGVFEVRQGKDYAMLRIKGAAEIKSVVEMLQKNLSEVQL